MTTPVASHVGPLRSAMVSAIKTAIADTQVQVVLGYPWPQTAQDIIAVGGASSQITTATMGRRRTRDESIEVEVLFSVFRPGGQEQEQVASDRAYALLSTVEHYLRMTDPTVGGTACECLLTQQVMDSAPFSDDTGEGRTVEVLATFSARARISD